MNILFVCTSNKDRGPALEEYFKDNYPNHYYKSAGVNKYFTAKKGTTYITVDLINWADIVVYAEQIHYDIACRDIPDRGVGFKDCLVLGLGEYKQGQIGEDYLIKADMRLKTHLDKPRASDDQRKRPIL